MRRVEKRPPIARRPARPGGALRRRIDIATFPGEARAVLEDDFHNFRVSVRHRDGVVTAVTSEAPRHPNALCPAAGQRLSELVGMRLDASSVAAHQRTDARLQCTHQIDLAGLAIAALANGLAARTYEVEMPDRVDGAATARLWRDGALLLSWDMRDGAIVSPEPFSGRELGSGFTGWASTALPADLAEAALVLRRAVFISSGRTIDLDTPGMRTGPIGGCWAWQPERADAAVRMVGSTWDFTDLREALTRGDQAWLRAKDHASPPGDMN